MSRGLLVFNFILLFISASAGAQVPGSAPFSFMKKRHPDTHGFLVKTNGTWDGNLGGLSGANAKCLTDLQNNAWLGKTSAVERSLLTTSKVKAFICGEGTCNDLNVGKSYHMAVSGSGATGGTSFTVNSSGSGPGSEFMWNTATTFGANLIYYSGRETGTTTNWPTGAAGEHVDNCSDWGSTAGNGRHGNSNSQLAARWSSGVSTCNTLRPLVCIVHP